MSIRFCPRRTHELKTLDKDLVFAKCFLRLPKIQKPDTKVIIVLSQDCDLVSIVEIAIDHHWDMVEVSQKESAG